MGTCTDCFVLLSRCGQSDPKTGEMVFFSYRSSHPFAYYSVVSAEGKRIIWEEPIPELRKSVMMHDFAITSTYSM